MPFDLTEVLPGIVRYCQAHCFSPEEAEDLAQEILLTAWENRERIARADNPGAYLTGIARHALAAAARRGKERRAHCVPENARLTPDHPAPDEGGGRRDPRGTLPTAGGHDPRRPGIARRALL